MITQKNVKSKHFRSIGANVWCYEQVCLAEMFNFSTTVNGKLSYTPCYALVPTYLVEI